MLNDIAVFGNETVSACNIACQAKNKLVKGVFNYKEFEDEVIKINKNYYLTEIILDVSCIQDDNKLDYAINLKRHSRPHTRIIIITPPIEDNDYDKYLRNGFYDIIINPNDEAKLIELIKDAIANPVKFSEVADRIVAYKPKVEIIEIIKKRIKFVEPTTTVRTILTAVIILLLCLLGSKVIMVNDFNPVPEVEVREPIMITFMIDDTEISKVSALSGDYIVPPEIHIEGYEFTGWDYDFSGPIEESVIVTAIYECTDTENYPEKIENLQIIDDGMTGEDING